MQTPGVARWLGAGPEAVAVGPDISSVVEDVGEPVVVLRLDRLGQRAIEALLAATGIDVMAEAQEQQALGAPGE